MSAPTRLIRSMLFVPGSKPAMFPKAAASEADAVCLDLEDSVLPDEKATARTNVIQALREIDFGRRVRMVRINSLDTKLAEFDLADLMGAAGDLIDIIMIPKVGSAAEVEFVDGVLTRMDRKRLVAIRGADRKRCGLSLRARDRPCVAAARGAHLRPR